jgi:hypothetical protein
VLNQKSTDDSPPSLPSREDRKKGSLGRMRQKSNHGRQRKGKMGDEASILLAVLVVE